MATKEEQLAMRRRRGHWVRLARERLDKNQEWVAVKLGYSAKSLSTVSKWEDGKRPIPSDKMEPLARLLHLPDHFLVRPPLTDEERLDRAVREAEALEREDWDAGEDDGPEDGDAPSGEPRRRSA